MLLRASSRAAGLEVDLHIVTEGESASEEIEHSDCLLEFAEAVVVDDEKRTCKAREKLIDRIGEDGLVDAAAVVAAFNMNDRIADATGIPTDETTVSVRQGIAEQLGIGRPEP